MRLFKLFSKKKKRKKEEEKKALLEKEKSYNGYVPDKDGILEKQSNQSEERKNIELDSEFINIDSKEEREAYIRNHCDCMIEAAKQIDDAKVEYEAVTSYLNDMQHIDLIAEEDRLIIDNAARNIVTYTREREKYRNSDIKLTASQRQMMERYEQNIIKELKTMQNNEAYQGAIKKDIRYLEGEKAMLYYEKNEIIEKQKSLKTISITVAVLAVTLFIVLGILSNVFEANLTLPFILTVIMAAGSAIYILVESNRNRVNIKLNEKKRNRAVNLLNKVKIKYINNTSCLEYEYAKFSVKNSAELEKLWQEYMEIKEIERRFRTNTDKLNYNNEVLIKELKKHHIEDADIWIYQPAALIDRKEMVEIRHRLNVRRQKLRERIGYNEKIKKDSIEAMKKLAEKNLSFRKDIFQIFDSYEELLEGNT